jgi:cyclase
MLRPRLAANPAFSLSRLNLIKNIHHFDFMQGDAVMTRLLQRREVLQGVIGGVATITVAPSLQAASPAPAAVLADNINLLNIGGVNVVVHVTQREVVLVDTGPKAYAPELIEQLLALSTSINYTLFNTHWHSDQTGANLVFRRMNSKIIAHEKTLAHLSTTFNSAFENHMRWWYDGLPGQHRSSDLQLGDEIIRYGYLPPGHTSGDIYVWFRNANIVVVGDMVSPERDPELDWYGGGQLGARVEAMDILLGLGNDTTQFVPSYGPVITKAQIMAERDMLAFLYEKLVEQIRMGFSAEDSLNSGIMNGLMRTFDNPRKFVQDAHMGLLGNPNTLAPNVA